MFGQPGMDFFSIDKYFPPYQEMISLILSGSLVRYQFLAFVVTDIGYVGLGTHMNAKTALTSLRASSTGGSR
jgi:hypothetical protein